MGKAKDSLNGLTVAILKDILKKDSLPLSGKKADLIKRILENISEETLIRNNVKTKYCLTDIGKDEINDNAYISYMHKVSNKTVETENYNDDFNIWTINRLIDIDNIGNWKNIVEQQEKKVYGKMNDNHNKFMKELKNIDPVGYKELRNQDKQIEMV